MIRLLAVALQRRLVTFAQLQRRGAFPRVGEPAGLGQLVRAAVLGRELHAAGRADRRELPVIAGEQQLCLCVFDIGVDLGQPGQVGHRGLVDYDEITGAESPGQIVRVGSAVS